MVEVFRPNYAAQDAAISEITGRFEVWRLVFGILVAAVVYIVASQVYFGYLISTVSDDTGRDLITALDDGSTPFAMFALLFQFAAIWLGVAVACTFVHKRHFGTVIGSFHRTSQQFLLVLFSLLLLGVVIAIMPPWSEDVGYTQAMPISRWIILLPISLLALLVQTGAEEVFFRGYLQQQLAARFRSPLIWIGVPSVLFALGHYMPNMAGENAVTIAVWAGFFGIMMADLTARAGSLGPAMAVHFVNNLSALVFVSLPDQMSGLALYHTPFGMADTETLAQWLPVDFAFMFVMWLAARLAIRR